MPYSRVVLALAFLVSTSVAFADDTSRLHQLFADDNRWEIENYPELATYAGVPGENDRWTDLSPASIALRRQHPRQNLTVLQRIDRSKLSSEDQLNYDLFTWKTQRDIEGQRFPSEYLVVDPLEQGVHRELPQVLDIMPRRTVKDYEDAIKRLQAVPKLVDQNIALLQQGVEKGITQPKIVLRDVPAQVSRLLEGRPEDSPLLKGFSQFPSTISAADQERLRREAAAVVDGSVDPAMRKFRDYLAQQYLPKCRETIGISSLPDGAAWYQYQLLVMNTTTLAPQQIHELGLKEVKRIRGEMDRVMATTGFKGSFADFVQFLRTDPRFYYTRPEELVTGYRDICKRIDYELPRLFSKLPRTPYGVREVDAYDAPSQTTAFYEPGPVDGSRAGTYRVNTYKLDSRPKFEMEVLSMHESVPGHHLQIALAHELQNVPDFRKRLETTAFVEGWGLYAESLGYEMGFYKDPYSKFGQLSYDAWRACRLVVDTGMHAMGWTRQQAIDYMQANTALTKQNIEVEVDRYISWPGQATGYKLGQLKIRELRTLAEQRLGQKFDVRQFHEVLLSEGALPLDILETRMKQWIDAAGAGQ